MAPQYVAADRAGNLYFSNQNTVLRLDATTGVLSLAAGNGTAGYSGDKGLAVSAQLYMPKGVAIDAAGNLFIVDAGNYCIRKVANGVITTIAGTGAEGYSGDGPATSTTLFGSTAIAVDSAGNLYFAETDSSRVRKVANGFLTTVAGTGTPGFDAGVNDNNVPAISVHLSRPAGVAVDSAGAVYIADTNNSRIRKIVNGSHWRCLGFTWKSLYRRRDKNPQGLQWGHHHRGWKRYVVL